MPTARTVEALATSVAAPGRLFALGGTVATLDDECGWSVDPLDGASMSVAIPPG